MRRAAPLPTAGVGRALQAVAAWVSGLAVIAGAMAAHVVRPKATSDHPEFAVRALSLPDGASLAFYVRAGREPALVLVPETHGDRTQFQEPAFLAGLPADRQIVIVESRGQGRSWPPPTPEQASIERYADDVLAVVRELKLGHWHIGGHSLGGMIALEIAGRSPAGLVGAIALEGWVHHTVQAAAFPAAEPRPAAEQAEMRRQREERYRSQGWTAAEVAALGQIWRHWERGDASVEALRVPLLTVWGDRGRAVRPTRAQLRLPERRGIEVRWVPGADHYVTDAPFAAATATEISRFLAAVERPERGATTSVPRPNIVLILVDDLGYADLGCYGSRTHRTPHIDRLAGQGLRFTDFHSNGAVCSPTRAALLTGCYPQRYGIEAAIGFVRDEGVPLEATLVSEVLRGAGYRSAVFGKWHVGHVAHFGPNAQGFDESACANNNPDYHSHVSRDGNVDWYRNGQLADEPGYLVDVVTRHATRFIAENRERPFFLYVPHLAGHFPYQGRGDPPHRTAGRTWDGEDRYGPLPKPERKRAYREMVEAVDDSVGQIVAALEAAGVRDRTLIFVTSDNGGYLSVSDHGGYRGEKGELFEGGHRVAAIAHWPGRIAPGTAAETAMTADLMPTFLAVAGVGATPGLGLDGVDLSAVLVRRAALPERPLFWRDADERAVRLGPWKLHVTEQKIALFHLGRDPGESQDVAAEETGRVRDLSARLAAWEVEVGPRDAKRRAPSR